MSVRFIAVDHDVPGASGFLITTPTASIAFTGDHRWHGLHPELTERFADEARGADVLIQEAAYRTLLAPQRGREHTTLTLSEPVRQARLHADGDRR